MPETNAHFEPVAWWYTRKKIGRGLAQHYELANDLPPRLLALISEIDGKPKTSTQSSSADKPRAQSRPAFTTTNLTLADVRER